MRVYDSAFVVEKTKYILFYNEVHDMSPGADVPFFPSFAKKSFTIPTKRYKLLCRKVLSNRQYVDENSRMWKISERTAGWLSGLEAVLSEADEDHLRVALIQPGSSRYLRNEVVIDCMCSEMTKRVEPRSIYVPCNIFGYCKGLLFGW